MSVREIQIKIKNIIVDAQLNETKTAEAIWQKLPIKSTVKTWGEEIYFSIPVKEELENPVEVVKLGDLGYWPPGEAFCIFFGKTPVSTNSEIKPASAVTIVGKIKGPLDLFKNIFDGEEIIIDKK
ncbi:hypothetical protein DRQ09_03470 [candidate division KSB1 bacterium]|nr:MAG: hypothetical protein DRQ09_03470 [candidate division KSB1 bacterium]